MIAAGHPYPLLTQPQIERIWRGAQRILAEMGMEIQNDELLKGLSDFGFTVDMQKQRVYFSAKLVENYLANCQRFDWQQAKHFVGGSAGVYHGRFHDPASGDLLEWNEERLRYYFRLARQIKSISGASMLGCRLPVAPHLEPLYERYYCWKWGAQEGSSIYLDELCPYLYDLYQFRAAACGKTLPQVFKGTVYLVPPLKLGRHEAYQVAYFRQRGLRVGIGSMLAMGATAPATLAGATTLNLAEQLALQLIDWAWFGDQQLRLGGSVSVMDMRTMIYPYGRPEMALINLLMAHIARYLGAEFHGHAGLSDAKLPSVEAGYQKALTAIPTLLACGSLWMDAGLLSTDEVCSPIQLILDGEFLGALQHFAQAFEINDETIGLDTILQVGPGGGYLDQQHTAHHFRKEHWQPRLWSRETLEPWLHSERKIDLDRAREQALALWHAPDEPPFISEYFDREIIKLIESAKNR